MSFDDYVEGVLRVAVTIEIALSVLEPAELKC